MKLMILDGNSVVNRAFYGIRPLTTRDGLCTNAIYGFLNILRHLEDEEKPDAVCAAFDLRAPTFRHEKFDGYKATRRPMPDELAMQMPVLKDVLRAMRIPIYECEGWEADDILGTAGRLCGEDGWDCVIVTGDRDSLQLIDAHVSVKLVCTRAGQTDATLYDGDKFRAEYGFEPKILIDLKSLMGDSSDNIPGVPGVGQKTASELLAKFGSLDGIYGNLESAEIRDSVRKKLEAGRDSARMSYDLATIRTNAPISFRPEDSLLQKPDRKALLALFRRLEFTRLIERYGLLCPDGGEDCPAAPQPETGALAALPEIGTPCAVAADAAFETIGVATADGAIAVPLAENRGYFEKLFSAGTDKVCADLKTMYHALWDRSLPAEGFSFDASLAAYLLNPSDGDYSVSKLARQYLARELPDGDPAAAAAAILALRRELADKLAEQGMDRLNRTVELPLCRVLAQMEHEGVAVDQMALLSFGRLLSERAEADRRTIYELAGEEFNLNSTQQLGRVLFEQLGLPSGKKTKSGYSTNADVLEKLKSRHPIVPAILDYRMLTKLASTYADGLVKVIADDGRIHTTFQNMVTATGRLSSTDPNLQNIPVRTELGSEIRKMFVPREGCVLVDADYSQIELRVLAHISGDPVMQQAFASGEDIHAVTASQVFGVPLSSVTPQMRRSAKAVNFGIVYGISEFSLADDIGVSRKEARAYIDSYLEKYAGVREYMRRTVEQAKRDGFVTTMLGRRRYLPELASSNYNIRSFGERCAMNTPIQGSAADLIKLAMLRVSDALAKEHPKAKLLLQVHDELIVECPLGEESAVMALVRREMEGVAKLDAPLRADAKCGGSWYEAK